MGLSSNIIWHQTDFAGLKSILTQRKFQCSYSLEDIHWKSSNRQIAFPMISFCDIAISDIYDYLGKYGKYTIGMDRNWGKKIGLTPVWYQYPQSKPLCNMMKKWIDINKRTPLTESDIWNILCYTKNYEGSLRKYKFTKYRFYDEREIRYVPDKETLQKYKLESSLKQDEYEEYKRTHNNRPVIPEISINFELTDIKYILVSNLNKRNKIRQLLDNNVNNVLILSYEQVRKDILGVEHHIRVE